MKPFLTYEKQIQLLKDRGLIITDDLVAKNLLEKENYYNLINGYKYLFLEGQSPDKFKKGTNLNEIYSLYQFDKDIKTIFFKYILKIENTIKSYIAYTFSEKYGDSDFLKIGNFDCTSSKRINAASRLIADIHLEISKNLDKNNQYIAHYIGKYAYVPLWILVKILTLGNISSFYSCMKQPERQIIAKKYPKLQDHELKSFLTVITLFRNVCAHDERLYNFKTKNSITDYYILNEIKVPRKPGSFVDGKNNILALLICLKVLLDKNDFKIFGQDFFKCLEKLEKTIKTIDKRLIFSEMGLLYNWEELFKL